jgi:hypothetical protein
MVWQCAHLVWLPEVQSRPLLEAGSQSLGRGWDTMLRIARRKTVLKNNQ